MAGTMTNDDLAYWYATTYSGTATDNQTGTAMTYESLERFLENMYLPESAADIIAFYDANGDGVLDFEE